MAADTGPIPAQPSAGQLLRQIQHLQVVGSVLYVAAHPDDENTHLLSWLASERGLDTAYLSMTRGGGGQNLIGAEQAELLGVIRTGELLAARSIDGASQRFTRMRDFGYSKSAEETLAIWGHDEALHDVVRAVRGFQPDVIVTRFGTTGRTHGHHLASAILAGEAFTAAADPGFAPDAGAPWRTDRLLHNRSSWGIDEDTDTSGWLTLDVGTYDPLVGRSIGEIAAASRTMHKSQGFGSAPGVGPRIEYLTPTAGTPLAPGDDLLEGLDLTWGRWPGTRPLIRALQRAEAAFDPRAPHAVLPHLARAHEAIEAVPDARWRAHKRAALERTMAACAGLWLAARAEQGAVAPGGSLPLTLTALARAPVEITLHGITLSTGAQLEGTTLQPGEPHTTELLLDVPADAPLSQPHWLLQPPTPARYAVANAAQRNDADTAPALIATFELSLAGRRILLQRPVQHAETDPVDGERIADVQILPAVTATFEPRSILVPLDPTAQPPEARTTARLTLSATSGPAEGTLALSGPDTLQITPAEVPLSLAGAGAEQHVEVQLVLTGGDRATLSATTTVDGRSDSHSAAVIDHPHLPRRTVLSDAQLAVVPVALDRGETQRIGYLPGSGDAVPDALRAVGYTVELLDEAALAGPLERFDAVVLGIRAYNTRPGLFALHQPLMDYVQGGGRLIVQYNTNSRWRTLSGPIGPAPFHISRLRVTDEAAPITFVDPEHPVLLRPNPLGPADLEGWVQERGLYFADTWDEAYQAVLSTHDPGEDPLQGSLLIARHGEGVFVYTGLSFFRQLPAGVPGAYRLFANLLAL